MDERIHVSLLYVWCNKGWTKILTIFKEIDSSSIHIYKNSNNGSRREESILWNGILVLVHVNLIVSPPPMSCVLITGVKIDAPDLILSIEWLRSLSIDELLTAHSDMDSWPGLPLWQGVDTQLEIPFVLLVL